MQLNTFGVLSLENADFSRAKPLCLLVYLSLEGVKTRRFIAELFWPGAQDALNSLSVALSQLRRGVGVCFGADQVRVWTDLKCDVHRLLAQVQLGQLDEALKLYQGEFLEVLDFEVGLELEEWLYNQREWLAKHVALALLDGAERSAAKGDFDKATFYAEKSYAIQKDLAEPETLLRLYALLLAGNSPYSHDLAKELEGLGSLPKIVAGEARQRLQQHLLGRDKEQHKLANLQAGQWLWLRGGAGMGKSTLLKAQNGRYLTARSGLPYATLEPLLAEKVNEGQEMMLRQLLSYKGLWLIDDWEAMDFESQELLKRLRELKPEVSVVISSVQGPSLKVDEVIELQPFSAQELVAYPEAWEKTAGIPYLVAAYVQGEPLDHALEARLRNLGAGAEDVYLALGVLEHPNLTLVRQALALDAASMSHITQQLMQAGLIELGGALRLKKALAGFVASRSEQLNLICLKLARQLKAIEAFSFFERSRLYWTQADLPQVIAAYLAWAQELLGRGFPQRAYEALATAPRDRAINLLRTRSLERAGKYHEALGEVALLSEDAEVLALKGAILWRLGQDEAAKEASENVLRLGNDTLARAEAFNTLGSIALSQGHYQEAARLFHRTKALWLVVGNQDRYVDSLNNLAVSQSFFGKDSQAVLEEALAAAADNPRLAARVCLNMGWILERQGRLEEAIGWLERAAKCAKEAGILVTEATIWNNLGVIYHQQHQISKAQEMYHQALKIAQTIGDKRMVGMALANLAELREDKEAWEEALSLLEASGYALEAQAYRQDLPASHPFKQV
jgi:tetratricopeptide (TPR) repeat protein